MVSKNPSFSSALPYILITKLYLACLSVTSMHVGTAVCMSEI